MLIKITGRTGEVTELEHPDGDTVLRPDFLHGITAKTMVKEIVVPEGIRTLADEVFMGLRFLEKVHLPDTIGIIGNNAFCECESLTEINIPKRVGSIGESAFRNCEKLEAINLYECHASQIQAHTFDGCKALKDVSLPKELYVICDGAFHSCYNLEFIMIPESTFAIGAKAFYDCVKLKHFSLPSNIAKVGKDAFTDTKYWTNKDNYVNGILWNNDVILDGSKYKKPVLKIHKGNQVVFADECFAYNTKLIDVYISCPNVEVGEGAFRSSSVLLFQINTGEEIAPKEEGVIVIGKQAFKRSEISVIRICSNSFCAHKEAFWVIGIDELDIRTKSFTLDTDAISNTHIKNLTLEDNMVMVNVEDDCSQNTTFDSIAIIKRKKSRKSIVCEITKETFNVPDIDFFHEIVTGLCKDNEE